jgi:outer membrane immunogenic protein
MNWKLIGTGIAAAALLATSFAAKAADIPRPVYKGVRSVVAYYNWTGFYVGVNAGYGWGNSNWDVPASFTVKPKGWLFGGTVGYNYQVGSMVYGVEGDFDWSDVKATATCGAFACETRQRWLGTARGRLGYAVDRFLPYITGGVAMASIQANNNDPAAPGGSATRTGWTLGGGVEYAFIGNWTAKLEYLYVDLGSFNCTTCFAGATTNNISFKENIVRAGINYKFSGPIFTRW